MTKRLMLWTSDSYNFVEKISIYPFWSYLQKTGGGGGGGGIDPLSPSRVKITGVLGLS